MRTDTVAENVRGSALAGWVSLEQRHVQAERVELHVPPRAEPSPFGAVQGGSARPLSVPR